MLPRRVAIGDDPLQALTVIVEEVDANLLGHARRLAYAESAVNPMNASVH